MKYESGSKIGVASYRAIQVWLEEHYGLTSNYSTLYGIVHHRLKAKPKVIRSPSAKRDESEALEFSKNTAGRWSVMTTRFHPDNQRIGYWCPISNQVLASITAKSA